MITRFARVAAADDSDGGCFVNKYRVTAGRQLAKSRSALGVRFFAKCVQ